MQNRTQRIDLVGREKLFGSVSLRDRHPADVLGSLLREIYRIKDCGQLKKFLIDGDSPYTEAGSEEYKKQCDEKLRQWLRSDLINFAAKSPDLQETTFYPAAIHLITGSRYYNGAGGDILHYALLGKTNDCVLDKTAERIKNSLDMLYSKHNIYRDITLILNGGSIENVSEPEQLELFDFPSFPFWCDYFAKMRRDVDLLLRLQIPEPLQTIRFLIVLLNFHLAQYVLRRCIASDDLCKACTKERSNIEQCRPIILISCCTDVKDKSQELYRRHVQTIHSRFRNNIKQNVQRIADDNNAKSIKAILEVLAKKKYFNLQDRPRFIKKMEEAELHINASPVEKVSNAISRFYGAEARQIDVVARLYSIQGGGSGLVAPKRSRYKQYEMKPDLLETLTCIAIAQHGMERLAVDRLLDWWYKEYGFVIGRPFVNSQRELDSLKKAFGREIDNDKLHENYRAFEELLVKIQLLEKLSDATAMVVRRYEIEEVEDVS